MKKNKKDVFVNPVYLSDTSTDFFYTAYDKENEVLYVQVNYNLFEMTLWQRLKVAWDIVRKFSNYFCPRVFVFKRNKARGLANDILKQTVKRNPNLVTGDLKNVEKNKK